MGKQAIMPVAGPAAGVHGMGERARASISALQTALPSNPDTIQAYVAGSQADGTATETSDLDIYYIVSGDRWAQKHRDTIRNAVGGRMKVDVIVDSPETAAKNTRLYGSFEYYATHGGILIYENKENSGWRAVSDAVASDIHLPDCAVQWLEFAGRYLDMGNSDACENGSDVSWPCLMYAMSVRASLAAALTHDNTPFRFTKRLADMTGILRDRSIIHGQQLSVMDGWGSSEASVMRTQPTAGDMENAACIAADVYDAVRMHTHVL